ncbi:MAG: SIMPL domain-containing protein [Chloroflexi bacterium]|nr:SIMPL domain-containing protein [Chloroflexota bacterium]
MTGSIRKLIPMAVLAGVLALSVACTQAKPSPTPGVTPPTQGSGDVTGTTPSPDVGAPTGNGTSSGSGSFFGGSPFFGSSSAEAAGYSYYTAPQVGAGTQAGIWVGGSGRVVITPDLAILSVGVEAHNKSVELARDDAAKAMTAIMDALKRNGIADKDIRTEYFNIQPQYVWNDFAKRQDITGYQVTNQLSVKTRDLNAVGTLIDEVSQAGGDLVRMNGVSFTTEHPETFSGQAREAAVKDALAKAQQFATLTGVTLGKLAYISETGGNVPVYRDYAKGAVAMAEAGGAAPTPISTGEMEITVYVQAVFGIA